MGIPMIKMRQWWDGLIFIMGIPKLLRLFLFIESISWWLEYYPALNGWMSLTDNMSALFEIMVWRCPGDRPFSEPMLTQFTDNGLLPDTQICGCACAGNAGNVFPVTAGKRSRHASRHVRHARAVMHAGIANQRFPLKSAAGENVPGIPGACATCNFTYLVRGPCIH